MSKKSNYEKSVCKSQSQLNFCTPLSFDQELVSVGGVLQPLSLNNENTDNVYGNLEIKFDNDLSKFKYKLYVYNATSSDNMITAAHLHWGASNQNGPVLVTLYGGPDKKSNGKLAEGKASNEDVMIQAPNISSIASIYQAIKNGNIYANVHSTKFPGGIIRGQLFFDNQQNY